MKLNFSILVCLSTLLLSACDPNFETTADICSTSQNEAVRISFLDLNIKASDDEYQPYLQDMLTALQITEILDDTDEQTALDEALTNINKLINNFMPYEIITNEAGDNEIQTDNALDIIESIIATTDPATVMEEDEFGTVRNVSQLVEAFKLAKQQLADGIDADDSFCIYTNQNIIIENLETQENPDTGDNETVLKNKLYAELRLTYDPFNRTFSQNIIMAQEELDPDAAPDDENQTIVTNFVGFYDTPPNDFKAVGYSPPTVRFGSINDTLGTHSFIIDDDFTSDKKIGTIEYLTFDAFCTLKDTEDETVSHDGDTFVLVGDELSIDSNNHIIIDETPLTLNGEFLIANTLIKDGVALDIDDTILTITGITVVLDENALLINSSASMTIIESGLSVSVVECADDIQTIEPEKEQCSGGVDDDGNALTDERNRREARTFSLNTGNTEVKRLRIETDYAANEVRIYISKFKERILDSDEAQDIETSPTLDDPSDCEKQAILDELALLSPDEGVRLTLVPDSEYDFVFELNDDGSIKQDENGAGIIDETQLPTPAYTFTGTAIPARQ